MGKTRAQQESQPPMSALHLLQAIDFAAHKYRDQRRKDHRASRYVHHPVAVALLLAQVAGVSDPEALAAALLHDTLEDTATTPEEIGAAFGARVRSLVEEVTDDKSLPKGERKRLQVEHAHRLPPDAGAHQGGRQHCQRPERNACSADPLELGGAPRVPGLGRGGRTWLPAGERGARPELRRGA
jgi:HD domain